MDEESFRALFARVMATGTMVEVLTTAYLADKPPEFAGAVLGTMRGAAKDIGPAGTMSDEAAEFMADSRVRAGESLEHMIGRVEAMLATMPKST
ncbi:hypothetical protein OMR07_02275 [Methylobacterium organophilum]|nr:hypothetical protein [Methylobacterium organophilum]